MRKIQLSLVLLFTISLVSAALPACPDTNEIDLDTIPCQGLTPVLDCTNIVDKNISVENLNTTSKFNVSTNAIGNRLNFTINFSEDSYSMVDCNNNSAVVTIGDFPRDDLWRVAIMLGFLGMAFIMVILGRISFDQERSLIKALLYVCGFLMTLIGIQTGIILSRVIDITSIMKTSLTIMVVTIWVLISYIFVYYMIDVIRGLRDKKIKKKEF